MYRLANNELAVDILDPVQEIEKLGSRYCTGGYIWQVTDGVKGPLLAGPHYPAPNPRVFDGQGAPDMFHRALGVEEAAVGDLVMCIGVGDVRRTSEREPFDVRYNPEVAEFVQWQVSHEEHRNTMEAHHSAGKRAYRMVRNVTLKAREVISHSLLSNTGDVDLPLRWFPHPFFPLPADNVLCDFSIPFILPESPGYGMHENGFITRKPEFDWARGGCYQALEFTPSTIGLTVVQKHDLVGEVTATTDYNPSFLPIWGNQNTFSFEPYMERTVAPGESTIWEISYQF
ncbi:MAG: hypothetical protein P1S60_13570 [Anaerolineae bacterium]|nr:hypothetical protein [Anaerolineae bacterium]